MFSRRRPHQRRFHRSQSVYTLPAQLAYLYGGLFTVLHTSMFFYPLVDLYREGLRQPPNPAEFALLETWRLGAILMMIWLLVMVVTDLLWLDLPKRGRTCIHIFAVSCMGMIAYGSDMLMHF